LDSRPRTRDLRASSSTAAAESLGFSAAEVEPGVVVGVAVVGSLLSFLGFLRGCLGFADDSSWVTVAAVSFAVVVVDLLSFFASVAFFSLCLSSTMPPADPALPALSCPAWAGAAFLDRACLTGAVVVELDPVREDFDAMFSGLRICYKKPIFVCKARARGERVLFATNGRAQDES